jgi:hypothetical protein
VPTATYPGTCVTYASKTCPVVSFVTLDGFHFEYYIMLKTDILSLLAKQSFDYPLPSGTVVHAASN